MSGSTYSIGAYRTSEKGVVFEPASRPAANTKRGAIFAHGYFDDATAALTVPYFADVSDAIGSWCLSGDWGRGYPGAVAQPPGHTGGGGAATWGNDDSGLAVGAGFTYLQGLGAKTDKVLLFGGSMGGIVVCNWARANPTKVGAIALVIPVLDLQYCHDVAPFAQQNGTTVASGQPNLAQDIEASAGGLANLTTTYYSTRSPIVYASQLAGIPIRVWESTNDVITNHYQDQTARNFCDAVGSSASFRSMGNLGGVGHNLGNITAQEVGAFLSTYA